MGADMSLGLVACALGSPGLQVLSAASAGRWRGLMGEVTVLKVHPDASHRAARLQVLRRVLDLQADGRWSLRVQANDASGLVGPLQKQPVPVLDLQACLSTWPHAVLLRRLFLWVDGKRVDERLAVHFPGAVRDMGLDPVPALPPDLALMAGGIESPLDALGALRVALLLHRRLLSMRPHRQPGSAWIEGGELTMSAPDLQPSLAGGGQGPQNGFLYAGWTTDAWQTGGSVVKSRIDQQSADKEVLSSGATPARRSPQTDTGSNPAQPATLPSVPDTTRRVTCHDEWDYRRHTYLKHWVSVHEQNVHARDPDLNYRADVLARFPSLAKQIKHSMAQVRPAAPRRQRRLQDGEEIDMDAALDAFVGRRSGLPLADGGLYEARPRHEREVCVALLLDTSGSTGYPIPGAPDGVEATAVAESFLADDLLWQPSANRLAARSAPRRRVIDVIKDTAAVLCEALHALGDRHAVFAFSGEGRHQVDFTVVKRFDQVWSAQTAAALAALQPTGATRTGTAVRHALQFLRAEPARHKLLIVISDGYPQDNDYGPDPRDLQYGLIDTAQALREAERARVSAFNISVDAAANDYLRRMCPGNRYWVVNEADAMPATMFALFRRMTVSNA